MICHFPASISIRKNLGEQNASGTLLIALVASLRGYFSVRFRISKMVIFIADSVPRADFYSPVALSKCSLLHAWGSYWIRMLPVCWMHFRMLVYPPAAFAWRASDYFSVLTISSLCDDLRFPSRSSYDRLDAAATKYSTTTLGWQTSISGLWRVSCGSVRESPSSTSGLCDGIASRLTGTRRGRGPLSLIGSCDGSLRLGASSGRNKGHAFIQRQ